jgi:DNA-binding NarL/FixJ family response regulator
MDVVDHKAMKKQRTWLRMYLVSAPGPICEATCATLAHAAHIRLVALASGALSATQLLQHVQPDLILLDANLPEEEMLALLRWLNDNYPNVHSLVATLTTQLVNQALAHGAENAFRRDELPSKLAEATDHLLVLRLSSGDP